MKETKDQQAARKKIREVNARDNGERIGALEWAKTKQGVQGSLYLFVTHIHPLPSVPLMCPVPKRRIKRSVSEGEGVLLGVK